MRLGRYCVEMHSGTAVGALSFLYWLLGCEETGAKAVFTLYWIAFARPENHTKRASVHT